MAKKRGQATQRKSKKKGVKHTAHKSRSPKRSKPEKAKSRKKKAAAATVTKKRVKPVKHKKPAVRRKKEEEVTAEEFFMPSPIHIGKYKIPLGIRFLIVYLCFIAALYIISFISSITFPTTILFGQLVTGARAVVVNAFLLLLVLSVIYGLWKRKWYAFDLSIGFFMFSTLNSLLSITLFEWSSHPFRKLMLLSFASLVIVNIVIIWYILKEKKYFYAKEFRDKVVQHTDKMFLYTVITFWVIALLMGATLGLQYYSDVKEKIDSTVNELGGNYYTSGYYQCMQKTGEDRDVCLLVLVSAYNEYGVPAYKLEPLCSNMESDFYTFVCYRSIG